MSRVCSTVLATTLLLSVLTLPTFATSPARAQTAGREWTPLADATIHPGVQTVTGGNQCTANFVFTDPAGEVYIGQSAHCAGTGSSSETDGCTAGSMPLGTEVTVGGAQQPGTLVYSSWLAMQDVGETDPNACAYNDFGLVRLDPADYAAVNPSLPFYGGPQGISPTTTIGETVYTYGNSSLRPTGGSQKSGTARGQSGEGWTHDVFTLNVGVPGDSGSAFLNAEGQAFGALSTLEVLPSPGSNGVSDLSLILAYLAAHGGLDITMADGTLVFDPNGASTDTATGSADGNQMGEEGARTSRLTGTSRVETAVAISQDSYPDGADAVVLARTDLPADALAGTALAQAQRAPVLLSPGDRLHPATAAEIDRVLDRGDTVFLLGGDEALSQAVADSLDAYDVRRLAGPSRFETAIQIADATTGAPGQVLIANGLTFADALVAGPAAALRGGVVVLSNGNQTHSAVDAYLAGHQGVEKVTVGSAATTAYPGNSAIVGQDAQGTSVLVAQAYADQATVVGLARVDVFADALAGGAHAATLGTTILLTDSGALSPVVADHLRGRAQTIDRAVLYGGTGALSTQVEQDARAAIR